jgi:hypothetical protein
MQLVTNFWEHDATSNQYISSSGKCALWCARWHPLLSNLIKNIHDFINHIRWLLQMENLPNKLIIICEFRLPTIPTMHIPILQFN